MPLLIATAGAAAYANSLRGEFILDDKTDIVENSTIRHLWPVQDLLVARSPGRAGLQSRPLVNASFALDYALGKLDPFSYHVTNLAIHLSAALLLFGIIRRTLLLAPLARRPGGSATRLALGVALLWTVHPLQTEAVTYVVQRYESLMGLFYLLALYAVIRCGTSAKPVGWAVLAIVATVFALGCKEVSVSLPIIILLYDRALLGKSFRTAWRRRWGLYLGLAAAWAVFFAWQHQVPARPWAGYHLGVTWDAYARSQPGVILHYLHLSFWPGSLCLDYSWPVAEQAGEIVPPLLLIAGLLGATVSAVFRRSAWGLLGGWFFLILAPTSSVLPINDLAVEHRMYLPLAAVIAAVLLAGNLLLGNLLRRLKLPWSGRGALHGTIATALVASATLALGVRTWLRNEDYRTNVTIWEDTVRQRPGNGRAQYNLGNALLRHGQLDKAVVHYEKALAAEPGHVGTHNNLGTALLRQGRLEEAIAHFQQALKTAPDNDEAHSNLGLAFSRTRRVDEAIAEYSRVVELRPDCAEARYYLGRALYRKGRISEAKSLIASTLRLEPNYADAHYDLARLLNDQGDLAGAVAHLCEASRLSPEDAMYANTTAWLLATCPEASLRNGSEAERLARRAVERSGAKNPVFSDTLAAAQAEAGHLAEAVETARRGLLLARQQNNRPLADEIRRHLALFEKGSPVRDAPSRSH
jgi:tetratricopeptide (TPR) repeat protein